MGDFEAILKVILVSELNRITEAALEPLLLPRIAILPNTILLPLTFTQVTLLIET